MARDIIEVNFALLLSCCSFFLITGRRDEKLVQNNFNVKVGKSFSRLRPMVGDSHYHRTENSNVQNGGNANGNSKGNANAM
jgi:hypothetical protein